MTTHVPNMNKIRDEGVVFTRAYTAGPKCAPSRISMLTGRYASRNIYGAVNGNGQFSATALHGALITVVQLEVCMCVCAKARRQRSVECLI